VSRPLSLLEVLQSCYECASLLRLIMQLSVLTVLTCLIAWVAADGVRNGYERVWLWYVYQIDLTLPEAQRQIGKRCIKWDYINKICPPTYQPTGKKGMLNRCTQVFRSTHSCAVCVLYKFQREICSIYQQSIAIAYANFRKTCWLPAPQYRIL